jgi:hypothetical protein
MVVTNFAFARPRLLAWVDGEMPRTKTEHRWLSPRAFWYSLIFPLSAHSYCHGRLSDLQPEKGRITDSTVSATTYRHSGSYRSPLSSWRQPSGTCQGLYARHHVGMVRVWIHVEFFFSFPAQFAIEMPHTSAERWRKTLCQAGFLRYKEG